jgi:hypothetical protein
MNHLSEGSRGEIVPQHCPTGLDLILQARAMRHQWFVAAFARLSTKVARLGFGLVARARPSQTRRPAVPERLRFSGRVAA